MKRRTMWLLAATTLLLLMTGAAAATARTVLYVDGAAAGANDGTSWEDAFTDLQSALAVARDAEVWVAAGVYTPTPGTDRTASFVIPSGATVLGGFEGGETDADDRDPDANPTVLSGEIGTPARGDNSIHVVTTRRTKAVQTLDGFEIGRSSARVGDENSPENSGGGLVNHGGSPVLRNLRFTQNWAHGSGGGMYSSSGRPKLAGVEFIENRAGVGYFGNGGGAAVLFGGLVLTDAVFSGNSARGVGGGAYVGAVDLRLVRVTFRGNVARSAGGGLDASGESLTMRDLAFDGNSASVAGAASVSYQRATLDRVSFSRNRATRGAGALAVAYDAELSNVTFHRNEVSQSYGRGAAIYVSGNLNVVNATFHDNSVPRRGGIIFSATGTVAISQSVFWHNGAQAFGGSRGPKGPSRTVRDAVLDFRCVAGIHCSGTLLHEDPHLQPLASNGGYAPSMALGAGSSAIDAGTNARCAAEDQRGVVRPVDGDGDGEARCDLGAYEYVPGEGGPSDRDP